MGDVSVFEIIPQLLHCHFRAVVLGFLRGCPQMRDHDRAFHACDLRGREIRHIPFHRTGNERIHDGFAVYQDIPGKVQDDDALLHQADGLPVDHALRAVQRRHVDGEIITFLVKLIHRLCVMDIPGKLPCGIYRYIGVISVHIHAQMDGRVGNPHADGPQADDSQLLAVKLSSGKGLFRFFGLLRQVPVLFMLLHPVDASDDIPGRKQHPGQHQLLDTIGIGARRIEYYDSLFRTFFQRNVVHSGPGTGNRLQVLSKFHLMHGGAADKDRICLVCAFYPDIILVKSFNSNRRDWIQAMIFIHLTDSPLQTSS